MADTVTVQTSDLKYRTIVTDIGHQKEAAAKASGQGVLIVEAVVGDGGGSEYIPTGAETALVNEVWRGPIASMSVNETSPNMDDVLVILDSTVGGFTVREVGLYDEDGDLVVIANYPPTAKAVILEGFSARLDILLHVLFTNPESVTFKVDPNVDSVSTAKLEEAITAHNEDADAHALTISAAVDKAVETATQSGGSISEAVSETVTETIREELAKTTDPDSEMATAIATVIQQMIDAGTISVGGGIQKTAEYTLTADSWQSDSAPTNGYIYVCDISDEDVTSDLIPYVTITEDCLQTAYLYGLCPNAETGDGYIRFKSVKRPEADIVITCSLMTQDGGSSGTVPIATEDTVGGIKASDTVTVDEDGTAHAVATQISDDSFATSEEVQSALDDVFGS